MKIYISFGMILLLIIVTIGATGYLFLQHVKVSDSLRSAYALSDLDDHDSALDLVISARNNLSTRMLSNQANLVDEYFLDITTRKVHKQIYDDAFHKFEAGEIDSVLVDLGNIPQGSFYYHKSIVLIEQVNRRELEKALEIAHVQLGETFAELSGAQSNIGELESENQNLENDLKKALNELAISSNRNTDLETELVEERVAKDRAKFDAAILKDEVTSQRSARKKAELDSAMLQGRVEQGDRALVIKMSETHPQIKAIVNGELNVYFDPIPAYADSSISPVVSNVMEAFSTANLYGASINRVYTPVTADINIKWIKDYGSHTLGVAIYKSVIEIGLGSTNCLDEWVPFDANTVTKVLWHELGHSLGYGHSNDSNNVMHSTTSTRYIYERSFDDVLPGTYYLQSPICEAGTYIYSVETTDTSSAGFDVNVLPPGEDPSGIFDGTSMVYMGCGGQRMLRFSGECTVAIGSTLHIQNRDARSAIRISGTIIRTDEPAWPDMTWDEAAFEYDPKQLDLYWSMFN